MKESKIALGRLLPNLVTFLGLCIGITSIKLSIAGRWEIALVALTVAAIIDGMDGALARLLNCKSKFGAELDSLADMVSFGVAPAFMLYFWELKNVKVLGWAAVMTFIVCMAIRLARFNSTVYSTEQESKMAVKFFWGVPAPAGGILFVLPIIIWLGFDEIAFVESNIRNHYFLFFHAITVSMLIISKIPTFSLKKLSVPIYLESLVMFLFAIAVVAFILKPWITIPVISVLYILTMPFSVLMHSKMKAKTNDNPQ